MREAFAQRLVLEADLDGDGAVDPDSEETIAWVCAPATRRLSRLVGRQSLPLADGVTRCTLTYFDAAGRPISVPVSGLDAAARRTVGAAALEMALRPSGLTAETTRRARVAFRGAS